MHRRLDRQSAVGIFNTWTAFAFELVYIVSWEICSLCRVLNIIKYHFIFLSLMNNLNCKILSILPTTHPALWNLDFPHQIFSRILLNCVSPRILYFVYDVSERGRSLQASCAQKRSASTLSPNISPTIYPPYLICLCKKVLPGVIFFYRLNTKIWPFTV